MSGHARDTPVAAGDPAQADAPPRQAGRETYESALAGARQAADELRRLGPEGAERAGSSPRADDDRLADARRTADLLVADLISLGPIYLDGPAAM
jgi:hypothetical protein